MPSLILPVKISGLRLIFWNHGLIEQSIFIYTSIRPLISTHLLLPILYTSLSTYSYKRDTSRDASKDIGRDGRDTGRVKREIGDGGGVAKKRMSKLKHCSPRPTFLHKPPLSAASPLCLSCIGIRREKGSRDRGKNRSSKG